MKFKKLSKKLALNKKTITNLNVDEMNGAYGGDRSYTETAPLTNWNTLCRTICITNCDTICISDCATCKDYTC